MVGTTSVNPLSLPPTKQVKKIEIQKVVEGFDMEQTNGLEESASNIDLVGGVNENTNIGTGKDGDLYENAYDNQYHGQYDNLYGANDNMLDDLTTDIFHGDPPNKNKKSNS
jgi:hypothetical protein